LIKPILHRILVKPDVLEEVDEVYKRAKAAGLSLDIGQEKDREQAAIDTGVVIDMGDTVFKDFGADNPLKIGTRIIYARYGGKNVTDPATKIKYVLLNDEDVIAISEGA
jgi:co-chaperonin GroES (HSP10)